MRVVLRAAVGGLLLIAAASPGLAQRHALTTADYDRAAKMLGTSVNPLVVGGTVNATWLPDGRFWYVSTTATGREQVLIDPAKKSRVVCDAQRANGAGVPEMPAAGGRGGAGGRAGGGGRGGAGNSVLSPDGKRAAFIKEYNLWVRDVASGTETQLTTDGVKDFGYATDNAGWATSDRAIVVANPVVNQMDLALHAEILTSGLQAAEDNHITGKAVTPFLLEYFHTQSKGESLRVNIDIIKANSHLAALLAISLHATAPKK